MNQTSGAILKIESISKIRVYVVAFDGLVAKHAYVLVDGERNERE